MSSRQRLTMLAIAAAIAVVAVVLILVINPGSGADNPKGGPATVTVRDAKPVGGVQQLKWKKGQTIDLTVKSDTADEVHFHGYDVHKDVAKGGSVNFRFPATIDGKFIVELEQHKQTLAEVEVTP
jgi:FtsP/CotA-like multicopper oxidase with cupredoxin domain